MVQITKVPCWPCVKTIPLVFDDALSYYESLCAFRDKLNEIIDALNAYEDELKQYIDEKAAQNLEQMQNQFDAYTEETDGKLDAMQDQLDQISQDVAKQLQDMTDYVNARVQEIDANTKAQIAQLTAQVSTQMAVIYQRVQENLGIAKEYTDLKISMLIESLPSLTTVYVLNPVTGKVTTIQQALNDMYDTFRYDALTAAQYDSMQLTAEAYDNKELTAWEYDRYGVQYFLNDLNRLFTFSGNTGNYITYEQAFRELWQNLRTNGITAGAYDALELTAETYDGKQLTAYAYDWSGVSA